MANDNVPQGGITSGEKKQLPARAATYNYVIDGIEEHQEQLLALAFCLENELRPKDPKNPKDGDKLTAYRLAQIIYEMVSSTELVDGSRDMLMQGAA